MKILSILLTVLMILMIPVTVAFAEDVALAESDETSEETPDDWFGMVSLRSGALWNFDTEEWTPFVSFPLFGYKDVEVDGGFEIDIDETTEEKGPNSALLGVTYHLGSLRSFGVAVSWAEYLGLNVGPCLRYEFGTEEVTTLLMVSVVDLSFDQGNVDRQRKR